MRESILQASTTRLVRREKHKLPSAQLRPPISVNLLSLLPPKPNSIPRMGFWNDGFRSSSPRHSSRASTSRGYGYGSSSRARPRSGLIEKTRRFLRKVYDYMRRHPLKVFMLVIMPLLTSGALVTLLSRIGIRLPRNIESMFGSAGSRGIGAGGRYFARGGARDFGGGTALPGMGGGIGQSVSGVMKLAQMFM